MFTLSAICFLEYNNKYRIQVEYICSNYFHFTIKQKKMFTIYQLNLQPDKKQPTQTQDTNKVQFSLPQI